MPPRTGPTTELGSLTGQRRPGRSPSIIGWERFRQDGEHVPELRWPGSVRAFEQMLTDAKLDSLYWGTVGPILDFAWWIDAGEAHPEFTEMLAQDLGLPDREPDDGEWEPPASGAFRFNFLEHLQEALLAPAFGHYYFELIGEIDGGFWRLKKLGKRHPATLASIETDDDGGLRGITQHGWTAVQQFSAGGVLEPQIPVDRLLGYVWRGDARTQWTGRSAFRSCYAPWLIKMRLMPVDAINHERAGGVPWIKTDDTYQGTDQSDLQQLASEFRVGEEAGAALPPGASLELARVGGTDVVGSMRYLDELMAGAWSGMVRQLGQTETGSRALGQTFAGIEDRARSAIARWFRMTFREHLIEDWWAINVGEGVPHPTLKCKPLDSQPEPTQPQPPIPVQRRSPAEEIAARAAAWRGCQGDEYPEH